MRPEADVVVLACSLNDQTRELADTAFFAAMKPGSILVNVARGGVVDDRALMAALDRGKVATAILDVFDTEPLPADDPLWTHPGVRLTPHTSFAGDGVQGRWDALFLDNIGRFARGEPLERVVDPTEL
jgi:phosphoglycerate dehydrogenase-like enzyme